MIGIAVAEQVSHHAVERAVATVSLQAAEYSGFFLCLLLAHPAAHAARSMMGATLLNAKLKTSSLMRIDTS